MLLQVVTYNRDMYDRLLNAETCLMALKPVTINVHTAYTVMKDSTVWIGDSVRERERAVKEVKDVPQCLTIMS